MYTCSFLRRMAALLLAVVLLTSCETGFESMNENPTQANEIQPEFLFTTAELAIAGTRFETWRSNLIYPSAMVQQLTNTWWAGEKYLVAGNENHITALWLVAYNGSGDNKRASIKLLQDIIHQNRDDERAVNKIAAARILRVFMFQRLTDMYGDIPYREAAMGFIDDNITPAYTPQSEIYPDMLNELAQAAASFDPSLPTYGTADLLYSGDIGQWQKFAYSLMLRLGLRLVKVDPGMAQEWVQRAIAGGVMEDLDDSAIIHHQSGPNTGPNGLNSNPVGDVAEVDNPMLTERLVTHLQETGDPRLRVFAATYEGPASDRSNLLVTDDPAEQVGWPVGYDGSTIQDHPSWDEDMGMARYAQLNRLMRDLDDPTFLLTYAEVAYMLAEAAVRGWHPAGDPAALYEAGTRAAMNILVLYDAAGGAVSEAEIDAYLAANPYDPANAMEQINAAYWVATYLNGHEAWANWRRTGYPVLQAVDYPGNATGGTIPRRLTYPSDEQLLNSENYQAAVSRQGPDQFTTRVWWDAP